MPASHANTPAPVPPVAQGLYDPRFEHDACGIGLIAHIKGHKSPAIVRDGLDILLNLDHRGAKGSDPNTGDGAGILLQLPDKFLRAVCVQEAGFALPPFGDYGVGVIFMPQDPEQQRACRDHFGKIIREEGQRLLGWRTVPTMPHVLGETAAAVRPAIQMVFIQRQHFSGSDFERKLYRIRRRVVNAVRNLERLRSDQFYIASLSGRTLVYKGMLTPAQLEAFYPDLSHPAMESAIALVHSRFSTNTFPNWARAHPYRYVIHNGEINTLRGNINWMRAREKMLDAPLFKNLAQLFPIVDEDGSDSAMFDNVLEFLILNGFSPAHAMMMLIPEPWQRHTQMDAARRSFYEYHACLMEPWDGPAAMAFTDGVQVGATLDRNGLRPARYVITADDRLILASETGVLNIRPEDVVSKGRLEPGRMLLVDTQLGRIIADDELKSELAAAHPYREWLDQHLITLDQLPAPSNTPLPPHWLAEEDLVRQQLAFGYTFEDLRVLMAPMAQKGVEAIGSMGDDTPPAVLSDRPRLLYDYFKQLFAQVTNPPIDALREELVTATETYLGTDGNLLKALPENARRIKLPHPLLTNEELARLRHVRRDGFRSATLPMLYEPGGDGPALQEALEYICQAADRAIEAGANLLILSDRGVSRRHAPVPALLATGALHHHLIRQGARVKVSLIVESAEPREVHHFACLLGYGAEAINPYLALASLQGLIDRQLITDVTWEQAVAKYIKAAVKGIVKICSKMGISTVQSYGGAQIFEALGLHEDVVARYFTGTPTRIQGSDLPVLAEEALQRHKLAFPDRPANGHVLPAGGRYQVRSDGEDHAYDPATVHALQNACRTGSYRAYQRYAAGVHAQDTRRQTLRSLLELKPQPNPVPLEEVESVEALCRRFKTGAMSYGSISLEVHTALAIAMNRIGGRSNTGEGGEARWRYAPLTGDAAETDLLNDHLIDLLRHGDSARSSIKQVASGRFGVTSEYLVNADEIQIKMAQGAKPGEGGQLPGSKVYPWIAKVRLSTPGVGLISPPPHHDIYSIEDLAQLIFDLKNANPRARINVKLVSEVGVGTIAAGVAKGKADVILISGDGGGTGAAPQTSIKHAGLPWELGLAETHQTLVLNDLRSRVRLETDGQLKTGRDVIIAALLGAEEFGFSTAPLISLGCVMMRVCHLNTCPVGVATQDPVLRSRFEGKPEHVVNFMRFVAQEARELMAALGVRTLDELIGRTDLLDARPAMTHWKARGLDLSAILFQPDVPAEYGRYNTSPQQHGLERTLDHHTLLDFCRPALEEGKSINARLPIRNVNRTVGALTGSELTRLHGANGLPDDTIRIRFDGTAGQSFGAFLPRGMSFTLAGDANDYFGKGLSGGKLAVFPPPGSRFVPETNIIIGNVALYGATSGAAYINGQAGERFAVRNSGATAVVEGVGDHGCEYMTGGEVAILGRTGRNFAAGMSGGVAYVLDEHGDFAERINREMVDLEPLDDRAARRLRALLEQHIAHTGSPLGRRLLEHWSAWLPRFVRVIPRDYRRVLAALEEAKAQGLSDDAAAMVAFEANKLDVSRVAGN